jgi:hypothetical protein
MSIAQHEIELKELLTRVMREPLQPLQAQLDQTSKNLDLIDQQLKKLRDEELAGMDARFEKLEKSLKQLHTWANESAAHEFKDAILPPVCGALESLLEKQSASLALPMQSIRQEVTQTTVEVGRLTEHTVQGRALADQRDASLAEHWRLTQMHVKEATNAAVERLSAISASANAAQEATFSQLVDAEVSKRIDKLVIQGRWALGLAVAAVCVASVSVALLLRSLH